MRKSLDDEIEQLYARIEFQKKIYALAIKMKKDVTVQSSIKAKIEEHTNKLNRLYDLSLRQ
jgi:hypothetical protein